MQQQHDYTEIYNAFTAFTSPGQVFEVRLLHRNSKRIDAGYFDHPMHAATAISALQDPYQGVYYTLNPVDPDLLARSYNRISPWAQATTMDPQILRRQWLPIDIDPDRVPGISSTDLELSNSFKVASTIANMLELEGWPRPYINISGNGCHVLYAMEAPNTDEVRDAVQTFLRVLDGRFKALGCSIDTGNYNASRIFRVAGTWARKGDNIPARPHRKAYMVSAPQERQAVTLGQIKDFNTNNLKYQGVIPLRQGPKLPLEYPGDEQVYRGLNQQALHRVKDWVPEYFPAARPYKDGFRIKSEDLGLSYEEDLTIHPYPLGIKYFGVADQGDPTEGRRTVVSLIAEFVTGGDKFKAAQRIANTLKLPLTEFDILSQPVTVQGLDGSAQSASLPGITATAPQYDFRRVPTMAGLQEKYFKEPVWIIPNVLPTGNIMLAARPKMRKTWLALQLALAVCGGTRFLNWPVNKADVLFLALEDNERRLKSRVKVLQTFDLNPPDLSGFRYWTGGVDISATGRQYVSNPEEAARTYSAFPRGERGVEALNRFLDAYPDTKLVVIDTYAHFREQSTNRDVYQRDYDQMMPITQLCARREICCMVVHHEKKGLAGTDTGDFMEDVSGTTGITGAVDGVMSIKGRRGIQEGNEERMLLLSGRDVPHDISVDIRFDAERGGWLTATRANIREQLLKLLHSYGVMSQAEIVGSFPTVPKARVIQVLTTLKFEGHVLHTRSGYTIPNNFKGD